VVLVLFENIDVSTKAFVILCTVYGNTELRLNGESCVLQL